MTVATDAKEMAHRIINGMPDNTTLDDIIYELYVRRKIQAGLDDLAAGRVVPHELIEEDLRRWRESSGA